MQNWRVETVRETTGTRTRYLVDLKHTGRTGLLNWRGTLRVPFELVLGAAMQPASGWLLPGEVVTVHVATHFHRRDGGTSPAPNAATVAAQTRFTSPTRALPREARRT
jgi:hypothetical protein